MGTPNDKLDFQIVVCPPNVVTRGLILLHMVVARIHFTFRKSIRAAGPKCLSHHAGKWTSELFPEREGSPRLQSCYFFWYLRDVGIYSDSTSCYSCNDLKGGFRYIAATKAFFWVMERAPERLLAVHVDSRAISKDKPVISGE